MSTRRDHRQTHVRPRPPSTGRPAPPKVKPRGPGPTRLAGHRPIQRSRGLPLIFRVALIFGVLLLGGLVLYIGARGVGSVVGGIGSTLGGFINGVSATATPQASLGAITAAPTLQQPTEPYTSQSSVDLVVTVPAGLAGDPNHRIRVYLTLPGQSPSAIEEAAIAPDPKTIIPVKLENGINDFSVTITGQAGESDPSAIVRFVFDNQPPKITVTSPKNNAVVNGKAVTIKGTTQPRTTLLARDDASGSSIAGTAGSDGSFTLSLALAPGANKISITGTDPAGNVTDMSFTVKRGAGKLTAVLSASTYQIKRSRLPVPVTLFATVTNPDGQPLASTDVTFTLSMPGIPTVTIDEQTDASGKASFKTTVPRGASLGQGSATVLVSSTAFGSTQDFTVISIVK